MGARQNSTQLSGSRLVSLIPFRFKHSAALRQVVSEVVRGGYSRGAANTYLAQWSDEHIAVDERARFGEMAEAELLNLQ